MSACSPQRFLANNRNLFADAILSPSSVLPVTNKVLAIPYARTGTARALLTGTYTGTEQADYEIEITDTTVEDPRISAPTFSGAGSGAIGSITAAGTQQTYTVELTDPGTDTTTASVQLEGATIRALATGTAGNSVHITVDQSSLSFAASSFSLLADLTAGTGGPQSPFLGQGFDWDSAVLDGNGLIPSTAHRVAFGDDRSAVYLAYKAFAGGVWNYHVTPALVRDVPKGALVYFVTGGRTVTVSDGAASEVYTDVETAFDLLNDLRTQSGLVVVDGVVSNDRAPAGQGARELTLRTDAHAEVSGGAGTPFARGFESVTVGASAGTQLVTATCYATTSADHPLARLGSERWALKSSLLGDLGTIVTGQQYDEPGGNFGLRIPVRLPLGYGAPKGRFSVAAFSYATAVETPICPVALSLGPDATDQTITLTYTARPSGDCNCTGMAVPNLITSCLGDPTEGGAAMAYESDTIVRLKSLYSWHTDIVRGMTAYGDADDSAAAANVLAAPRDKYVAGSGPLDGLNFAEATESLRTVVSNFESALAKIDPLTGGTGSLREDGAAAWDVAFAELQADIAGAAGSSPMTKLINMPSDRYDASLNLVLITAGVSPLGGADANTIVSGDGCWRDYGGTHFWAVEGSAKGGYAPLFSNHPYYSCRTSASGGVFSTHEFALQLNIKCPENLAVGDQVTLTISESGWGATYQIGDEIVLPIVAASPLYLTGGRTGDPTQTWTVSGSVSGPLTPCTFDPDAPAAYSYALSGGPSLGFLLAEGGIPWAKGDRFRFAVEGGHYRWRKDGGAWQDASPPVSIPVASAALDAGLSLSFTAGAAASFVTGDIYKFRALQPWAISNTQSPSSAVWKWSGSTATYAAEFSEPKTLAMVAMLHDLPAGATVTLWGGATSGATDWSEVLTYRAGCIWKAITRTAQFVRLEIASATGGSVRWPWIGDPLTTSLSADVQLRRDYLVNRPGGNLQGGRYVGSAVSGDISWTQAALSEADVDGLVALLDHVKAANDEPLLLVPQVTREADPVLFARISSDGVDFPDRAAYNQVSTIGRRVSAHIPLQGVWQ